MADIKNLPRSTLISIVQNVKDGLSKGKTLNKLNITREKKNTYVMAYFWDAPQEKSE